MANTKTNYEVKRGVPNIFLKDNIIFVSPKACKKDAQRKETVRKGHLLLCNLFACSTKSGATGLAIKC